MALSPKADSILYNAKWDAVRVVEKMGLKWDIYGDTFQNKTEVQAVVEPLLAPHHAAGVKLSYSKDNSLWTPVFNVSYDICKIMIDRAAEAAREAKRAAMLAKKQFVKTINLSVEDGYVTAVVVYTTADGETDLCMLLEAVDKEALDGVARAQAKLLASITERITKPT